MSYEKQSIFARIGSDYYSLTSSEKKLADLVLSSQESAAHMSISTLAAECGVAEATVSRFCRRLGYGGYSEFKLAIANASTSSSTQDSPLLGEIQAEDSVETICRKLFQAESQAMVQTMEVLSREAVATAATMLKRARRVLCMGSGGSMLIASEAAHLFSTVSGKFYAISDSHMQAMSIALAEPEDVILYFSYSGVTAAMLETMKQARARNIPVILITRFLNSPGADLSTLVLQCGANENPLQSGSVAARIAQMYLMDILFSEFCKQDMETVRKNRAMTAAALTEKHI